jgi:hypothetical protein
MLERYVIPLAPLALLAVAAIACLLIFMSLEKEIRRLKLLLAERKKPEVASSRELRLKLDDLNARIRDAEERAGIAPPPPASRPTSVNLNKRTQAIRLARKGETPNHIAASLSIPRKEVELLLKVYGLSLTNSNEITA